MVWEENSRICLHTQLIAILSRIGVYRYKVTEKARNYKTCSSIFVALHE